jgi:choice-of-anchor A domain-containing protein
VISNRTSGLCRLGLALAAFASTNAFAAPTFTGNAATDFAIPNAMTFADPGGIGDVGIPVAFPVGTVSGWDMSNVSVFYDAATDRLYVGLQTPRIFGDADGDGDPGASSPALLGNGGFDLPDLSGTEGFSAYFDVDQDGIFDAIAGVSGTTDVAGFSVVRFSGSEFAPAFAYGAPMPGVSGSLFASPSASRPHIEFYIQGFSQIAPSSGSDASQDIGFRIFSGSLSDDGIGEDFFPAVTDSQIIDIYECGDGVLSVGEECDDGNLVAGDGCDTTCTIELCGDGTIQAGETCDDGNYVDGDGCDADCEPSDPEFCDGLDNDGDGYVDEGLPTLGTSRHWTRSGNDAFSSGTLKTTSADYDPVAQELSFSATIQHTGPSNKANGFWMAINDGPNPKGNAELALFYFDASNPANPQLLVYAYNGENADTSFFDGSSAAGTQAPDQIASSLIDPSFIRAISVNDNGTQITMSFTVDVAGINAHYPLYSAAWPWSGAQFDDQLGLWFHWVSGMSTSYAGGWLTNWSYAYQGWSDLTGQPTTGTDICAPVCGNDGIEAGESCDDGNHLSGDGCSDSCEVEVCGDGILSPVLGEDCDDGNTYDGDGCSAACGDEFCGDHILTPSLGESCDDGNNTSGDGCNAACDTEYCGDGILSGVLGEACDDGNNTAGDGCSPACALEFCGDGTVGGGESCDDGNIDNGDGCNSVCQLENCGDGVVNGAEACDDGNTVNGDGCDDTCQVEGCPADFGAAEDFNVFVQNDYWGGLDVGGAVAVGNQIDMMSFSINHQNPGGIGVVAGNVLWLGAGTVHGDAIYGNTALVLDDVDVRGALYQASPINFAAEYAYLENLSDTLAAYADNGTSDLGANPWGHQIVLTGTNSGLNVFTVPDYALSDAKSLTIDVPAGATVLVNVTGSYIEMHDFGMFLNGATPERTLWNLPDATGLNLYSIGVQGSILANEAYAWFYAGSMDGQLIVSGLEGTGEPHHHPFSGSICP